MMRADPRTSPAGSAGRTRLSERLRARYGGRYRYGWSRLLLFAALDTAAAALLPRRRPRRPIAAEEIRRILAIRVDGIGDVVALLPALEALRARFPAAEIDLLTSPPGAQLMADDPRVDRVIPIRFLLADESRGRNRAMPALREWLPVIRRLRARHYDLAIDFRGDVRTIFWLAHGSAAVRRLSWFNVSAGRPLLTDGLPGPGPLHEVEANLRLVGAVGAVPVRAYPRFAVTPLAAEQAERLLRARGVVLDAPRVGFHCFTISPLRTWPAERFAEVIRRLSRESGVAAVLLGSALEAPAARELMGQLRGEAVSLVGQTSLRDLVALLSRLDLLVCLDSGLLHLAAAVGTPTVSLFGPGDPTRWRPLHGSHTVLWRGLPCSPCRDLRCPHPTNRCMREIGVDEVVAAARHHLAARFALIRR